MSVQYSISKYIDSLKVDDWRLNAGFSEEVESFNKALLRPARSDAADAEILADWLRRYQPCIFGRIAAGALKLITYCILTEQDLGQSDEKICDKIQRARLHWKRQAYLGNKSAFLVAALMPKIAFAKPDNALMQLAIRICELYLLKEDVKPDEILVDRITLETTSRPPQYREWETGVNFFSSQGDGRWWHDHRIPGGIVFSVNSVGHMAKSGARRNFLAQFEKSEKIPKAVRGNLKIDSLGTALIYAMKTIANAQNTNSGKATCLLDLSEEEFREAKAECPIQLDKYLPSSLARKDFRKYTGWYHTDVTIPSDYFRSERDRPREITPTELYFTYLFDQKEISFRTMGVGVPG